MLAAGCATLPTTPSRPKANEGPWGPFFYGGGCFKFVGSPPSVLLLGFRVLVAIIPEVLPEWSVTWHVI